jgi:hypothetical protein
MSETRKLAAIGGFVGGCLTKDVRSFGYTLRLTHHSIGHSISFYAAIGGVL